MAFDQTQLTILPAFTENGPGGGTQASVQSLFIDPTILSPEQIVNIFVKKF